MLNLTHAMLKIEKMSVAERIATMEQLWDSLSKEKPALRSPAWHREVLADRREELASGKARFITLAQLRKKLSR